jgi:hypothetical protein
VLFFAVSTTEQQAAALYVCLASLHCFSASHIPIQVAKSFIACACVCDITLLLFWLAGDDADIPEQLKQYVDGSAQLPVKTYFLGGYGEPLIQSSIRDSCGNISSKAAAKTALAAGAAAVEQQQ